MRPKGKRPSMVFVLLAVAAVVTLLCVWKAQAVTVNRVLTIGNPAADSSFVARRDASDSTLIDSTMFNETFSYDTLYTWSDAIDYDIKRGNAYGADWYTWDEFLKFTGAAASVDYDSIFALIQAGCGSGGGIHAVTFVALNTADSSAVGGVPVFIQGVDGSDLGLNEPTTSVLGVAPAINLSADSFRVSTATSGYLSTVDTVVVAAAQWDTLWLTSFDPGSPIDTFYCRCYFWASSYRDHPDLGVLLGVQGVEVCVTPKDQVGNSCSGKWTIIAGGCGNFDSTGYVYLDLSWSSCLLSISGSDTTEVEYTLKVGNFEDVTTFTVPDSSSYQITF